MSKGRVYRVPRAAPGKPASRPISQPGPSRASGTGRTPDAGSRPSWSEIWLPTAARIALGLVLGWFAVHELLQPNLWTGYVPLLSTSSTLAVWAVLAHGGVLLVLAVALVVGIAPRVAAAVSAVVMAEIVIALAAHGLSDIVARDVGVLGLALAVAGQSHQRLVLRT